MGHGRDQWQILEAFLVCVIQNVYTKLYCFAFRISQAITRFLLCAYQQASRRIVIGEGTPLSAGQIGGGWRGRGRCLVPVVV